MHSIPAGLVFLFCITTAHAQEPNKFVHPGILHTSADLQRIKQKVAAGEEPWKSGYEVLKAGKFAQADYVMRGPFDSAGRNPTDHTSEIDSDSVAAYQNAVMWAITGDEKHAQKAVEILNAWSSKLKQVTGKDAILGAGTWGAQFANAAEILRYTYPAWQPGDVAQCQAMLNNVFYPVIKDFAPFANGNWEGVCTRTMMAIAIFSDDHAMFDRAIDHYKNGSGNGSLTHYIVNDTGQCQESGRDQAHTQLGLGLLCEACQIAWNQGIDLYSADDNRLLKGFEYTAQYNLGQDVPFTPFTDTTGKYPQKVISDKFRGMFRSVWEMPWNHYHNLCGLDMPFTRQVLQKIRPEGPPFNADHPGFGTLLFSVEPAH